MRARTLKKRQEIKYYLKKDGFGYPYKLMKGCLYYYLLNTWMPSHNPLNIIPLLFRETTLEEINKIIK
jgi:hypothetical protein